MASSTYDAQYVLKANVALDDPCMTNLNSEFLFLLGGSISPNYQSGFHIFNVITKQWMNDGPNMLEPRSYLTCQAHNDHLFAIGGGNAASLLNTVIMINIGNISNIAHQNWSTLADTLSQSRNLLRSVLHEDDIYVIGGWSGNALSTVYGEVDVINTQNNTISLDSVLSIVAERVSPVVAFDVLYVFGGVNLVDNELDTMQYAVLSPLIWEQSDTITLPNGGRYGMAAGFFNESVFLIGGRTASNSNGFTEVIKYNMNSDAFTAHGTITHNIRIVSQSYTQIDSMIYLYSSSTDYIVSYDMASSTYDAQYVLKANVALDDPCMTNLNSEFLFLLGGSISPNYQSGFHIFDLNTKQWINDGPDMLEPRVYFSCNAHRDHLYVMGGGNAEEALDTVIVIDIRNVSTINHQNWSALDDTLSAKKNQLHSVVFEDDIYVIGGWSTGATATPYGHIDVIDTITNTIRLDSTLLTAAYGVSPVVVENTIYVFGGRTKTTELNTFQYALLTPTPDPTRAPSMDTIPPTSPPTTAPSVAPSFSPSIAPSQPPTISPSFSPTRYPTKHDAHPKTLHVHFNFTNLTAVNIDILSRNTTVWERMELIFAKSYLQTSELYANDEEEEMLEYKDFDFHLVDDEDSAITPSSVTFFSSIKYDSVDVGSILTFISSKRIFITSVTASVAALLQNEEITLTATVVVPIQQQMEESQSFDYVLIGLMTLMAIMSIISIAALVNNRRSASFIDDCKWTVLFIVGLQIVDFVSDVNLCLEIVFQFTAVFDYDHALLYIAGYGSVIFVVLPYVLNISMSLKVKQYVSKNSAASIYVEQRAAFVTTLVVLTGSMYAVLNLTSSRLFGLEVFNSGLTTFELRNLSKMKLYGTVLTENCPQLCFQLVYIAYSTGTVSSNTTLSFIASLLSIISVVLTYVVNNQSNNCFVIQYHLNMFKPNPLTNYEREQISQNKERKEKWKKAFCESIKTPRSCIEFGYVTLMNDGCLIHVVHYLFKHQLDDMMEAAVTGDDAKNALYPQIAKQYIQTLYKQHKKEVDASFNKHFTFQSGTMSVRYYAKDSMVSGNVIQLFSLSSMQRENSLSERVYVINQIKRLLDQEDNAQQIRDVLVNDGHDEETIARSFSFLKIEFPSNTNIDKEEQQQTNLDETL
eukprot:89465_1